MIWSIASSSAGSTTTSAPSLLAQLPPGGMPSTAMMSPAPSSFAPIVAHSPTAPWAKIATLPSNGILEFSAPAKPVGSMSHA